MEFGLSNFAFSIFTSSLYSEKVLFCLLLIFFLFKLLSQLIPLFLIFCVLRRRIALKLLDLGILTSLFFILNDVRKSVSFVHGGRMVFLISHFIIIVHFGVWKILLTKCIEIRLHNKIIFFSDLVHL